MDLTSALLTRIFFCRFEVIPEQDSELNIVYNRVNLENFDRTLDGQMTTCWKRLVSWPRALLGDSKVDRDRWEEVVLFLEARKIAEISVYKNWIFKTEINMEIIEKRSNIGIKLNISPPCCRILNRRLVLRVARPCYVVVRVHRRVFSCCRSGSCKADASHLITCWNSSTSNKSKTIKFCRVESVKKIIFLKSFLFFFVSRKLNEKCKYHICVKSH